MFPPPADVTITGGECVHTWAVRWHQAPAVLAQQPVKLSGAIRCGVEVPHHVPHEEVVPLFSRLGHPFKTKDVVAFPTIGKGGHVMMARRENWRDEEITGGGIRYSRSALSTGMIAINVAFDQILCVDSNRLVSELEIPLISRMRCNA